VCVCVCVYVQTREFYPGNILLAKHLTRIRLAPRALKRLENRTEERSRSQSRGISILSISICRRLILLDVRVGGAALERKDASESRVRRRINGSFCIFPPPARRGYTSDVIPARRENYWHLPLRNGCLAPQ
jgi:hypothetical protein